MMPSFRFLPVGYYLGVIVLAVALPATSGSAPAAIVRPGQSIDAVQGDVFTWSLGEANSTFSGWDEFSSLTNPPPDVIGQFGIPHTISETTGAAFLTSGGNIYSPIAATDFTGTINSGTGGSNTRIVAQFRTRGQGLAEDSILLSSDLSQDGTIAPDFAIELSRFAVGGFGGDQVDYLALWDLPSQDAYRIDFNAAASSMSLDQFYVDTYTQNSEFASVTAVPEPASWLALTIGSAGIGLYRIRRRKRCSQPTAVA